MGQSVFKAVSYFFNGSIGELIELDKGLHDHISKEGMKGFSDKYLKSTKVLCCGEMPPYVYKISINNEWRMDYYFAKLKEGISN